VLPDPGGVFLHRDFDGQELRLFAHFEQGDLLSRYLANPDLPVHKYIAAVCEQIAGRPIDYTKVKVLNFTAIYGGGLPAIGSRLRCSRDEAVRFRQIHNSALPGRVVLNEEIVRLARRGEKIRTLGGRLYGMPPAEPGDDKSYVLLNYLVQGSAADYTKETLVDWYYNYRRSSRLLVTVYDEINISAPAADASYEMLNLRDVMHKSRSRVPMRSKGKMGPSWGALASCP
jgi:DNA polymerase I-like protein with 3'-5' exonuclease and polymerase domains